MVEITVFAALLATALLYICEGPGFDQIVRQLHAFLLVCGEEGAGILEQKLNEGIFDILRGITICLEDSPENHMIYYAISNYSYIKETWLEDARSVAEPSIADPMIIRENVTLMTVADNEDEVATCLQRMSRIILKKDGAFVEDSVGFAERCLTQWMADFLTDHADELKLSMAAQRALDIYDLLSENPGGNSLPLIASYRGKFCPIAPKWVDALIGFNGEDFLYDELQRLADTVPAHYFTALLSWLISSTTKENAVLNGWRNRFKSLGA